MSGPAPRSPSIQITRQDERDIEFTLSGTDSSVANALRRVMLAEVPTLAIDLVNVYENSSVLHDEFIAHRLGLFPLRWRPKDDEGHDLHNVPLHDPADGATGLPFHWECECELDDMGFCRKCSVLLTLNVRNEDEDPEGDAIAVTSADLKVCWPEIWYGARPCPFEVAHFVSEADQGRASADTGILLVKLGPMQAVNVSCVARLGIGKIHAKFNPTCTVAMRCEPSIVLNRDLLEKVRAKGDAGARDLAAFCAACTPGVFTFDRDARQVILVDALKTNNIEEIKKSGLAVAKKHGFAENIVAVSFTPDKFFFSVETTGALAPAEIVSSALAVLREKLEMVQTACTAIASGGGGLGIVVSSLPMS